MSQPKRPRGIATLAIVATMIATMAVGFALLFWMQQTSGTHVFDRTQAFADLMSMVRPMLLILLLVSWRPAFSAMHGRSFISDRTHARALAVWPRLCIWAALIELTLGQGFVLMGLVCAAGYWLYLRRQ